MTDRAVSVTLDYIILLMIATIVLASVATVSATLIDGQVDRGVENELEAVGEKLATDIQDVERLVNASKDDSVFLELQTDLPPEVSGERYRILIGEDELVLDAPNREIVVTVGVASSRLEASQTSIRGGSVLIVVEAGTIEVREA